MGPTGHTAKSRKGSRHGLVGECTVAPMGAVATSIEGYEAAVRHRAYRWAIQMHHEAALMHERAAQLYYSLRQMDLAEREKRLARAERLAAVAAET
jgi:hypothetical protein